MAKLFSVYINGTNEAIDNLSIKGKVITSLANIMHNMTVQDKDNISVCLNGCSINNPDLRDLGEIFTFNLESQINSLIKDIKEHLSPESKLILNLYGFSRGGAAVFWICQKLKTVSSDQLEINVSSFEPIPGNFIRSACLDKIMGAETTLASRIANLRDCENVTRIQVLVTNQTIPDIACHGPLLPVKPKNAQLSVDVIPGRHKEAELFHRENSSVKPYSLGSTISFHTVTRFLESCGTKFNWNKLNLSPDLKQDQQKLTLLRIFQLLPTNKPNTFHATTRAMHYYNKITTNPTKPYINLLHQELITGQHSTDTSNCMLSVNDPDPKPSFWNGQKSLGYTPMFLVAASAIVYAATSLSEDNRTSIKASLGF